MSVTTISSREFNQDAGGAKKAAEKGPVVITDRGRPAHVLLRFEESKIARRRPKPSRSVDDARRRGHRIGSAEIAAGHEAGRTRLMYLLDTHVVSELRKAARADATVRAWAENASAGSFWLSTITVLELEIGVLRVERRDAAQGAQLRRWLEAWVLTRFNERMLDVDIAVAREGARLHVPDPRPERDALIGATALTHGLTLVTRNVGDFEPMGVAMLNPWLAPSA